MGKTYPKLKVYTKTGDKGETSLYGGKRVDKFDPRVETYGTIDELNSFIGVTVAGLGNKHAKISKELIHIQHDLFDIGALLANPNPKSKHQASEFFGQRAADFEKLIDTMAEKIPDFQCFLLPGVGKNGAHLHLGRTIARRAERRIVELAKKEKINSAVLIYLNRLSDLLFIMARFVNCKEKKKETIWQEQF